MGDRFTEEDLNILLSNVDEGKLDRALIETTGIEESGPNSQIKSYDFTRRERRVAGKIPALEMINDRFAKQLQDSLTGFLSFSPEIDVSGIQIHPFSEYAQGLPADTSVTSAKLSILHGRALIALEPRLVFALVDNYFGGAGQLQNAPYFRAASPIATQLVRLVIEMVFNALKHAWQPVRELDFDSFDSDTESALASLANHSEVVVVSNFHIRLEGEEGEMNIVLPYFMVEPLKALSDINSASNIKFEDDWEAALRHRVLHMDVGVAALLAEIKTTIGEVVRFKAGDVLPIEIPATVVLSAQGIPIYDAKAGISNGRYAVRIIDKAGPSFESNGL